MLINISRSWNLSLNKAQLKTADGALIFGGYIIEIHSQADLESRNPETEEVGIN